MEKEKSIKLVELYPEMFTFSFRGYEHNSFEKAYNKALSWLHKNFKFTRSINYIKQVNPYTYSFEVGNGWYNILHELISGIRDNDKKKGDWVTKLTQCKEKWGGLRFYVTGTSDKNWKLIHKAEEKSLAVCEVTGSEVEVGVWLKGWYQTVCRAEALKRFDEEMNRGSLKKETKFEDCWRPLEKSVVIHTPKNKR